jgi:glutathione S-transferase
MLTLYHAPKTRSFSILWLLEEIGVPYEVKRPDLQKGEQKSSEFLKLNSLGKVPIVTDGDVILRERAAIATYLADKYSIGTLAPRLDDPLRGDYLRWMFFAVGVMEPLFLAKFMNLDVPSAQASWGTFDDTNVAIDAQLAPGPYLLGSRFTAADVVMGGAVRWGVMWSLIEGKNLAGYVARLEAREAFNRAMAKDGG